ncbi:Phosphotransferase system, EIIC [anaerobic digester metagenome]
MGTSGLVGQFNAVAVMGFEALPQIVLMHFILPAVITLLISTWMRKKGWIKEGDMLLQE